MIAITGATGQLGHVHKGKYENNNTNAQRANARWQPLCGTVPVTGGAQTRNQPLGRADPGGVTSGTGYDTRSTNPSCSSACKD